MSTDEDTSADTSGDTSGDEAPRWAADEPTAVWNDSMMRDAGFDALAKVPQVESGPATSREVRGDDKSAVHVSAELTGGHEAVVAPAAASSSKSGATSWIITFVLAVGLGLAAYFVVRLLR